MNSYLIIGQAAIGTVGGETQIERKEIKFRADDDEKAKEIAKKEYPYITNQKLYREI